MKNKYVDIVYTSGIRTGNRVRLSDGGERGEEITTALLFTRIDLERKENIFVKKMDLPGSPHTIGRGALTGLCKFGSNIAVANASEIRIIDPSTSEIKRKIDHHLFGGLHSLADIGGTLYVTCTAANCILGFDTNGKEVSRWYAGNEPSLCDFVPDSHKKKYKGNIDFRDDSALDVGLHINHVFMGPEGDIILSLGAIHKYYNFTKRKLLFDVPNVHWKNGACTHDGVWANNHWYYSRTSTGEFIKANVSGKTISAIDVSNPTPSKIKVLERVGFLRGACHVADETFIVGQYERLLQIVDFSCGQRYRVMDLPPLDRKMSGISIFGIINLQEKYITQEKRWPELEVINKRAEFISKFITDEKTVCDLGSGSQILRKHLKDREYIPVDCIKGSNVIRRDLNYEYNLPTADIYIASGLLEHLFNPYELVDYLRKTHSGKRFLFSYGVTRRRSQDWKNDMGDKSIFTEWAERTFSRIEIAQMFGDHIVMKVIL